MTQRAAADLDYAAPPSRASGDFARAVPLSVMMFLQYAVWGVWLPYLATYLGAAPADGGLGFTGTQVGWLLGLAASVGAVSAPLVAGQVADRYMNAERALALLLLLGGVVKIVTAWQTEYVPWVALSVLYSVLYMPTLALTNSVAFAALRDPERAFPRVRVFGTIGWIVASSGFTLLWLNTGDAARDTGRIVDALIVSGALSIAYALFCVVALPRTPPRRDARGLAFAQGLALLGRPDVLVVTVAALVISMVHQCYFIRGGPFLESIGVDKQWFGPTFAIGQASEIVVLAVLGLFLKKLGYRWVVTLGALSFALRFGLFALGSLPATLVGLCLHGFSYGFFFAGTFLYVERAARPEFRHSAQTAYGIVFLGVGPVLSAFYNALFDPAIEGAPVDFARFWTVQAALSAGAMLLLLGFRSRVRGDGAGERADVGLEPVAEIAEGQAVAAVGPADGAADGARGRASGR